MVVNKEDFEKTGWAIKKKDITKKSRIGKGEFGGKIDIFRTRYSNVSIWDLVSLASHTYSLEIIWSNN